MKLKGLDKIFLMSANAKQASATSRVDAHVAGTAEKHAAEKITYSGSVTGATEVKQGLDLLKARVDEIITTPISGEAAAQELVDARNGEDTLGDRLTGIDTQLAQMSTEVGSKAGTKGRKPRVLGTIISDDGNIEDYTIMLPVSQTLNVPMVTSVITSMVGNGGKMTLSQLHELQNTYGWEMASHSHTHVQLPEMTDGALQDEIYNTYKYLRDNGLKSRNFITPFGNYDDRLKLEVAKYFRSMRISSTVNGGINHTPVETYELKSLWFTHRLTVDAITGYMDNTLEHYKYWIDKAVEQGGWLILSTHSRELSEWGYQQLFADVITYMASVLPIKTIDEALNYFENAVDNTLFSNRDACMYDERFAIGADGKAKSNRLNTLFTQMNAFTASTPLSDFENNIITHTPVQTVFASGLPSNSAGLLITHKQVSNNAPNTVGWSHQIYHAYASNKIYKRKPISHTEWGVWEFISKDERLIFDNAKLNSDIPNSYVTNSVTLTEVSTENKSGFPESLAGTLLTYSISNSGTGYLWRYQTYKPINTNKLYIRRADSLSAWGIWEAVSGTKITEQNIYNGLTPLDSFPIEITYTTITSDVADSGLPLISAGTLITHKLRNGPQYNWQTFRRYNSYDTWIRYALTGTTWAAWKQIQLMP